VPLRVGPSLSSQVISSVTLIVGPANRAATEGVGSTRVLAVCRPSTVTEWSSGPPARQVARRKTGSSSMAKTVGTSAAKSLVAWINMGFIVAWIG